MCKYVRRLETEDTLYLPRKQKQPSFEDCFFSSIFPFLPCYNFIRCKGVRCVSQNFDRWCGAWSFLLTRDFTVGKSSFFRRFDEPCFAARNRLMAENDRTLIARHRLFSVIFSLFVLAGVSPPASQKEKISRKFLCGACRAVFTERIFVITTKKPQWILDVFARLLRKSGQKSARQNRWEFGHF